MEVAMLSRAVRRAWALIPIVTVSAAVAPVQAQAPALQSQDLNTAGFVAELTEARRSEGVLSLKIRIKNNGAKPERLNIYKDRNSADFYVQAESKKYFMLTDTEKVPLTAAWDGMGYLHPQVAPGASYTWWAKYPAPPASVKKFSFYWPLGAPFDDVPITDK
jgi:hypothetical protein